MPSRHPVDVHVGVRLREGRGLSGLGLIEFTEAVGLSIQQIYKYEYGMNSIGSSTLFEFATVLGVSPTYFFAGFPTAKGRRKARQAETQASGRHPGITQREELALMRACYMIRNREVRRKIRNLVIALGSKQATASGARGRATQRSKHIGRAGT